MERHVHYEAAFEDYLRSRGVPYVPVDQTRQAIFSGAKVKSFDFLIYPPDAPHWIVDVKGRRFPYVTAAGTKRYWDNWVPREDLEGLAEWENVFGNEFRAYFVFAFFLEGPPDRWPTIRPHAFRNDHYAFLAAPLRDYREHCRRRSPKWQTVYVDRTTFRRISRPLDFCAPTLV